MRGDRVEIVVDTGEGSVRQFDVIATKAGRRVEVTVARGTVEVTEVTRSGQPVRSARFMASRVVALVEHPASDAGPDDEANAGGAVGRRKRGPDQPALGI
jgi:hypothetical protein